MRCLKLCFAIVLLSESSFETIATDSKLLFRDYQRWSLVQIKSQIGFLRKKNCILQSHTAFLSFYSVKSHKNLSEFDSDQHFYEDEVRVTSNCRFKVIFDRFIQNNSYFNFIHNLKCRQTSKDSIPEEMRCNSLLRNILKLQVTQKINNLIWSSKCLSLSFIQFWVHWL